MRGALAASLLSLMVLPALGVTPAQAADPVFEAAIEPGRIAFGESQPEAVLKIRTGAERERFKVVPIVGGVGFLNIDGRVEASAAATPACEVRMSGAGTAEPPGCYVAGLPRCGRTELREGHGGFNTSGLDHVDVDVPPNAESELRIPLSLAPDAPWTNTEYEVRFALRGETLDGGPHEVTTPRYAPAGRTGVRLAITTSTPSAAICNPEAVPQENRGEPITISGRSDPALAGQEVVLQFATWAEPRRRELARLRVRDDGTFVLHDWRPKQPGRYEVAAVYASQRPELTDDFSSPRVFDLTTPVPDPAPPLPAAPRLVSRSLRADRDGLVRLRLYCPAGARADCSAPVRLRIGGRTVAARDRITVLRGTRRTIRVRLSRPARRRVIRHRDVPATVSIGDRPVVAVKLRPRR